MPTVRTRHVMTADERDTLAAETQRRSWAANHQSRHRASVAGGVRAYFRRYPDDTGADALIAAAIEQGRHEAREAGSAP